MKKMINIVMSHQAVNFYAKGPQFSHASKMAAYKMCSDPVTESWKPLFTDKNLKERIEKQEKILSELGNPESLAMFLVRAKNKVKLMEDLETEATNTLATAYINAIWAVDCVDTWISAYENSDDIKISRR
jgi:hypothetical protein